MTSARKRYRLTAEAAQDLLSIARYTVKTWGIAQSRAYATELENTFNSLACKRLPAKPFSEKPPEIMVWHNKYHSVYFVYEPSGEEVLIIAVLHQKADTQNRLP